MTTVIHMTNSRPDLKVEIRRLNRRVYLMSGNGRILSMSEQYSTFWNAKRAARKMYPREVRYIVAANGHKEQDVWPN